MASTLVIEIQDDGTIKTDATRVEGTDREILGQLERLAKVLGGEVKVEKHEHHHHHKHSHGEGAKVGHKH